MAFETGSSSPSKPLQQTAAASRVVRRRDPSGTRLENRVRILPSTSRLLIRSRSLRPDSAKTYGNLVLETGCRKTDEVTGQGGTYRWFNATFGKRLAFRIITPIATLVLALPREAL
jgi:hypothetical protein